MTERSLTEHPSPRPELKPRPSRETLARALVGMWLVGFALGVVYLVGTKNTGLGVALMVLLFPVYVAVVTPFCQDVWRNPSLARGSALLWAWAILYLPPVAGTGYWFRYLRDPQR